MSNSDVADTYVSKDPQLEKLLTKTPAEWQHKMRRVLRHFETTSEWPNGGDAEVGPFMTTLWGQMKRENSRLSNEKWMVLRRARFPSSSATQNRGGGQHEPKQLELRQRARNGTLSDAECDDHRLAVLQGRCSRIMTQALQEGGYLDRLEQITDRFYPGRVKR